MYVDVAVSRQHGKVYKRVLLRASYREAGKVKHRTVANLSTCSEEEIQAIKLALQHKDDLCHLGSLKTAIQTQHGLSVGAIVLLKTLADRLHLTTALGHSSAGKLALWQVMARVINQGSRLSAVRLAGQHAVCDLLKLNSFNEEALYQNLDWLADHQEQIEKSLFKMRYHGKESPRLFLYDVTSSYLEGMQNELGDWGYNRDGKKGKLQIVIGLLTDEHGVPVSVEVFKGNTNDTKTLLSQIQKIAGRFGIKTVTFVGDRGMVKSAQIQDLKAEHFHYITAITKPQIAALLKQDVLQREQFTEQLCEVESDGMRYILRRNPQRVAEIAQTRQEKIQKIHSLIQKQNAYLTQHSRAKVAIAVRQINQWLQKLKLSMFVQVEVQERRLSLTIDRKKQEELSALDGCYVIKTELRPEEASTETVHQRYKDLALVEQGFRTIKTGFLETRPVFVRKEQRTKGHVLVVMLAYLLVQELQKLWAAVNVTVEEGILELSTLTTLAMQVGQTRYHQIPKPRELGEQLLRLAHVRLPEALPSRNIKVATRRKLVRE
jgi:transposase